jgi:hypothetical protein
MGSPMSKYIFLSAAVNADHILSKEHGPIIPRGEILDLDPEAPSVKWLEESKAIELTQEQDQDPGNSILDQNAENSIKAIESGVHTPEQLQELKEYETANKNRKTVLEAIENQLKAE